MPRIKVLKGVAHNIGGSFTSLMNYAGDDYSIEHVLRFARESGVDTLTINLLRGQRRPGCPSKGTDFGVTKLVFEDVPQVSPERGVRPGIDSVREAQTDLRFAA